jgi:GTPase SAR1 family protein
MRGNPPRDGAVFLSYAREDGSASVRWLATELQRAGLATWRDTRDVDISADFGAEIEMAIRSCRAMVLCLTASVVRSKFVRREIAYAQAEKRPIVVARFADVTPPIYVITNTFLDFFASRDGSLAQLLRFLEADDETEQPSAETFETTYLESLYREVVSALDDMVLLPWSGRRGRLLEITGTISRAKFAAPGDVLSPRFRQSAAPIAGAGAQSAFAHSGGRLAIVGGPGSGKTTTMLALTRDLVSLALTEPNQPVPVLVPAATWGAEGRVESDLMSWLGREIPMLGATLEELNAAGRLLLLVDGLDEAPTRRSRSEKTGGSFRDQLISQLHTVRCVVIASRPSAFEEAYPALGIRSVFELTPLTDTQINEFVDEIPAAATALRSNPRVMEIARTPLMLTILCSTLDIAGSSELRGLDSNQARDVIMQSFFESRLSRELGRNRTTDGALERQLGHLAMADAGGGGNRNLFSRWQARHVLGEDGLALALDMHVLVPAGPDAVRFFHLAMRDYFAFQSALRDAADPDDSTRDSAAWALWQIPDARAFDVLLGMLDDPYPYARGSAVSALGRLGDRRAIPALSRLLTDDTDVSSMYGSSIGEVARWAIRQIQRAESP